MYSFERHWLIVSIYVALLAIVINILWKITSSFIIKISEMKYVCLTLSGEWSLALYPFNNRSRKKGSRDFNFGFSFSLA